MGNVPASPRELVLCYAPVDGHRLGVVAFARFALR